MKDIELVQNIFDDRAQSYDAWIQGFWVPYYKRVNKEVCKILAEFEKPLALLDIGCATGARLQDIVQQVGINHFSNLHACDLSPKMVELAQENLAQITPNVYRANAESLPEKDAQFEVALLLFSVLGCVPTTPARKNVLKEVARILKPGGILILDVLNQDHEFYQNSPECFQEAKKFKLAQGWDWSPGDIYLEKEKGKPVFNHAFNLKELDELTKDLFSQVDWKLYSTETGLEGNPIEGHFFGVLTR